MTDGLTQRGSALTVSVVTPVFNEEACTETFYRRSCSALEAGGIVFEMVFVDDGSIDRTPQILESLAESDSRVKVLTLSRNFGHHPAVFAGLAFASGDVVVIIDGDLQDPPELMPHLVAECAKHELVFARRVGADGEPWALQFLKRQFRSLMRRLSNIEFPDNVGVFSAMHRSLKDVLLTMPERERYLVAMQMYLGFRVGFVDYARAARAGGRSKQSLRRLFRLGMNSLFSYSSLPLQFSMIAGIVCLTLAFALLSYVLYARFISNVATIGWASVMTVILGMGAVQLFSLWIICEYVDRIFENVKGRPYFIVRKECGQKGFTQRAPREAHGQSVAGSEFAGRS